MGSFPSSQYRASMRWLQILRRPSPVGLGMALASVVVVFALSSCADEDAPPVPEGADAALTEGRDLWRANCSRCHGGAGGGGAGPSLKGPWPDDRQPDATAMIATVAEGRGAMPRFGGSLSATEIESVVRYVREVL